MPKYNILYSIAAKAKPVMRVPFAKDIDSYHNSYYRFGLPLKNKRAFPGYTLIEQHISIFEEMIEKNQYHFTGCIKDMQGVPYQLHVFFNNHDAPTRCTLRKNKAIKSPASNVQISAHLRQEFVNHAIEQCGEIIPPLRALLKETIEELETTHNLLIAQFDCQVNNITTSSQEYLKLVEANCQVLRQLFLYTGHNYYIKLATLLNQIQSLHKAKHLNAKEEVAATLGQVRLLGKQQKHLFFNPKPALLKENKAIAPMGGLRTPDN